MSVTRLLAAAALAAGAMAAVLPAQAQTLTTLHRFRGAPDGAFPNGILLLMGGVLYGTTGWGGTGASSLPDLQGCGTVFAVNAATGAETVVYSFKGGPDGADPVGGVIQHAGFLYGTTEGGGTSGLGTVFRINPKTGAEKVLYSFAGGSGGEVPEAGLVYQGGVLYGTTAEGGSGACEGCGPVFGIDATTGAETVRHSFTGSDGEVSEASLIYRKGLFYGTTGGGGPTDGGTVFTFDAATDAETVLYSFKGPGVHDGAEPYAGLLSHGALYGTTRSGGPPHSRQCHPSVSVAGRLCRYHVSG